MGNCQGIGNAALVIQHPNGKVEKQYCPIMKMNPGHYVALLLPPNIPIGITRIKLLKPTDTLVLGHIYRLVTAQEVMKGLCANKQKQLEHKMTHLILVHSKAGVQDKSKQVKHEKHRNSIGAKSRAWHPSLQSISEAAG